MAAVFTVPRPWLITTIGSLSPVREDGRSWLKAISHPTGHEAFSEEQRDHDMKTTSINPSLFARPRLQVLPDQESAR